ncbi:hypothetical protein SASPL_127015 [Salvia splendens]|uniref:Uncharacterized protein n=1 Tax=Salvia splendens TaxID=180675 RepID=A0A8X8ZRP5_SALSN|nr:hypothetical protein SASPL_127015 [Salvia splendens]
MDGARYTVTLDEFKLFHGIDRSLYVILVRDLVRNPLECLYILGLWLCLVKKDISLRFFHENHLTALHGIEGLVRGVCIPALSDMLEKDGYGGYVYTPLKGQIMAPSHAASTSSVREPSSVENLPMQSVASLSCGDSPPSCGKGEVLRNERTMFVTFSKGYTRVKSNLCMLKSFIGAILKGVSKAKFTINGGSISG